MHEFDRCPSAALTSVDFRLFRLYAEYKRKILYHPGRGIEEQPAWFVRYMSVFGAVDAGMRKREREQDNLSRQMPGLKIVR